MQILDWLILLAAVAISLLLFYPVVRARLARGKSLEAVEGIDPAWREGRWLIYFMAPHCGMCRSTTPVIEALSKTHPHVVAVDASQRPALARALHVMATPAFVVLEDGRVAQVAVGAKSRKQIEKMIDGR